MLGTIVNALAIVGGSLIGLFFKKGIPKQYNDTVINALSLAVILIGLLNALKAENILLLIFSLALGSILGEFLRIEDRLEKLGGYIEDKLQGAFPNGNNNISKGFVNASLIYCIGAMAIMGALESGLSNNHQTLFAKSIIDGISAIAFTSSLGIGVLFSAVSVFIYQGFITITASFMKQFLIASVITDMSAIGGLLIVAIGINILEIKKIKVGNMLPAIFIPLIFHILKSAFFAM
ncbi:DUF554 domain-containing protein [Wukongibacter baidiensis]|uniref:DUF554 domain-containing protein n=1 Tax=Wukongibacter baidiensis TaxID=1723361 RepID=UPI003D7F94B3